MKAICWWGECCDDKFVKHDFQQLKIDLKEKLYGQPLVLNTVINSLKGHFELKDPPKALVLSFHGDTGTGKNHVANIIAKNLYKKGMESIFVKNYSAIRDFMHKDEVPIYKV